MTAKMFVPAEINGSLLLVLVLRAGGSVDVRADELMQYIGDEFLLVMVRHQDEDRITLVAEPKAVDPSKVH